MAGTTDPKKVVAVVVYPGVSMLELTSTYSTLNGLKMARYEVYIVAENTAPLATDTPFKVVPHKSFAEVPEPGILAVIGGDLPSLSAIANPAVRNYIQAGAASAEIVLGVGTGSVVLAACGLLKDRSAATHWAFSGLLEHLGARYVRERWMEDGKFTTTASGTAGMDLGLRLLARLAGENNARFLQLSAEYDPQPPFGGIDWSRVATGGPAPFSQAELAPLLQAVSGLPELSEAVHAWANSVPAAVELAFR